MYLQSIRHEERKEIRKSHEGSTQEKQNKIDRILQKMGGEGNLSYDGKFSDQTRMEELMEVQILIRRDNRYKVQ